MKKFLLQSAAGLAALLLHFGYTCIGFYEAFGKFESVGIGVYLYSYKNALLHFVGLSFGLWAFFALSVYFKYRDSGALKWMSGGLITALVLFLAGYIAFGINETWMFSYFMDRMGSFYLKVQYLFLFIVSLLSVSAGLGIIRLKKHFMKK